MTAPLVALLDMYGIDVRLSRYRHTVQLPDWLTNAPAFITEKARILAQCATGVTLDGPILVPADMSLSRTHAVLECVELPYSVGQAISAVYRNGGGPPCQAGVLDLLSATTGPLRVNTLVVTNDNLVLVHQQAPSAFTFPGAWAVGLGEGVVPADEGPLRRVAVRTLVNQLGMTAGTVDAMVRLIALAREETQGCWTGYTVADFRRCGPAFSAERILSAARTAPTAGGANRLYAIPRERVRGYLADKVCVPATALLIDVLDRL